MAIYKGPIPKEKCISCSEFNDRWVMIGNLCQLCFRKLQETKSIEQRLFELELNQYHQARHQHVENMVF